MDQKTSGATGTATPETLASFNAEAHRLRQSITQSAMTEEGVRQHLGWIVDLLINITATVR